MKTNSRKEAFERNNQPMVYYREELNDKGRAPDVYGLYADSYLVSDQQTWILPVIADLRTHPLGKQVAYKQQAAEGHYLALLLNLVKNSGIYTVSAIASPMVSLILTPFLTHRLMLADYGVFILINTMMALVTSITQFGLGSSFMRVYKYECQSDRERLRVLSTSTTLTLQVSIPLTLVIILTSSWLAGSLFRSDSYSNVIMLAALAILMQNLAEPGVVWLRADNHAVLFVVLSVASLIVNLVGTIIFVGFLRMGIAGALLAVALSNSIPVIVTFPLILVRAGLSASIDIARNLLTFGLPSIPTLIFVWVLQLADRFLLSFYDSLAQTASYSVAYLLGGVLGPVVIGPFLLAWSGSVYTIAKRDNAAYVFRLVFRWFSLLLLLSTFVFSLVATFVLTLLFPPSYHTAGPVIPVVAMSIMFYGIYNVFNVGASVQRKMWLPTIFTAASALLNISLNVILIPLDGMMGAAFATLISYVFLAGISYIANQRIYPVPFEIGMFLIATMIGVFLYVGSVFLAHGQAAPDNWGIQLGAVGLYAICLLALGLLTGRIHKAKRK